MTALLEAAWALRVPLAFLVVFAVVSLTTEARHG